MTERRIDPDDGVASLSSILVILSDTGADVFVPVSLPCWGIPGKIFQRTILESCLAEHIQKTSWSIRCQWISLHDLNMVWRVDSTRHRGIRKRPSKHTGRSARSRKVDPTCWTIAWMIGDGLGDKNHMDSYGITMNRPHTKGRVRILDSHNLHFFPMHITMTCCLAASHFLLPNLFRFHHKTTGKKAKAAPKAKVRMLSTSWRYQQIFPGRLEHMKYWGFKNRWFGCFWRGFVEGLKKTGMGVCVKLFEGPTLIAPTPQNSFTWGFFKLIWDGYRWVVLLAPGKSVKSFWCALSCCRNLWWERKDMKIRYKYFNTQNSSWNN